RRSGDDGRIVPFRVCGAPCGSVDILSRPFCLPETVDTGDWIETGHIRAYSLDLRTRFIGLHPHTVGAGPTPVRDAGETSSFASIETMADAFQALPGGE